MTAEVGSSALAFWFSMLTSLLFCESAQTNPCFNVPSNDLQRVERCLVKVLFINGIVCFFVLLPAEKYLLENWIDITPLAGTTQQEWLQTFIDMGLYTLLIALSFTLFWHIFGYIRYRIINWKSAGGEGLWWLCLILMMLVIAIFGYLVINSTQDSSRYISSALYTANGVFIFWLSSLILSPSTVKYAPLGAMRFWKLFS